MAKRLPKRWAKPIGKLHKVLIEAFPQKKTDGYGVFNVPWLAEQIGVTTESIYKWTREDRIPYRRVNAILKIKGCVAEFEDFEPYIV